MNKIVYVILTISLLVLTACGNTSDDSTADANNKTNETNVFTAEEFVEFVKSGNVNTSDMYEIQDLVSFAYNTSLDGEDKSYLYFDNENFGYTIGFDINSEHYDEIATIEQYDLTPKATIRANFAETNEEDNELFIRMVNAQILDIDDLESVKPTYENVTIREITFPASAELEITDKTINEYVESYHFDVSRKYHISVYCNEPKNIVWSDDEMQQECKEQFLLMSGPSDVVDNFDDLSAYECDISKESINSFKVFMIKGYDSIGLYACKSYGDCEYTINSFYNDWDFDTPEEHYQAFAQLIESIKLEV